MTIDQANQVINKHELQLVFSTYNILFTNDIVCGRVIEDMEAFQKSIYHRHKAKETARKIILARHAYEKLLNEVLSERSEFFADANDTFVEDVRKHVEILYFSIKREMDKHLKGDTSLIARLETTRTLCEFACRQFDKRIEELVSKDCRFKGFALRYLRLTNLLRLYDLLMATFHLPCVIDLNTKDCLLAVNILSGKLVDG